VGDKVHSHDSNCIYSIAKSNGDSIEFSLSITEQRAVGFIPAWSLASLQDPCNPHRRPGSGSCPDSHPPSDLLGSKRFLPVH